MMESPICKYCGGPMNSETLIGEHYGWKECAEFLRGELARKIAEMELKIAENDSLRHSVYEEATRSEAFKSAVESPFVKKYVEISGLLNNLQSNYYELLLSIQRGRECHPGEPAYELVISKKRVDEGFALLRGMNPPFPPSKGGQG